MKKIITAIGSELLNIKLRELDDIELKERDIFYKEGILEYFEKDTDIDIVILSEELFEEELELYLQKICDLDIEIYLIVNKKHFMEDFNSFKNVRLFNNENEVYMVLKNGDNDDEINYEYNDKTMKRVISVIGNYGVGKTVFCSLLGKRLAFNHKVLIINFDIFTDNLKYLFDLKTGATSFDIDSLITKAYRNLYILNGLKYVFNETNIINESKVKCLLDDLKKRFEYILIDTSSETILKYIKTIFPNCNYNIFLLEANSLELKKAKELLEIYTMDFNLDLRKTGVFINKYNTSSIDIKIIQNILKNIKILGKIDYTPKINSYINTYTKNNVKIDSINKFQKTL